jgi:hypothetical protein
MEQQLEELNKKMDLILELLNHKQPTKKEWTIENYKNSVLVKFPYNNELKEYVKALPSAIYMRKAWMFPKTSADSTIELIKQNFDDWVFTDLRN